MDNGKLHFIFRMTLGLVVATVSFILGVYWIRETVLEASNILQKIGTKVDFWEMIQDICFIPMKVMCATVACYLGLLLVAINALDYIYDKKCSLAGQKHQSDVDSAISPQINKQGQSETLNEEAFYYDYIHYCNHYYYDHYCYNMPPQVWEDLYMADSYIGFPDKMVCQKDCPYMDTHNVVAPSLDSSFTNTTMSPSYPYLLAMSDQYIEGE